MYPKNNKLFRLFALFTALALLPSLFFGNSENNKSEKGRLHSAHNCIALSECDMHRYPAAVFTDEIFRSNAVRISHSHSLRHFGRHDFFYCRLGRIDTLIAAVCILWVSLKLKANNISFSLKTIIKYIQDQDGIKI